MGTQQFCLRWNNHQTNLLAVFDQLLQNEAFVDVTLACEGLSIKAHKMVLSACSPYFQSLFLDNPCQHPIVILKDMRFSELKAVVDFMYKGEVNVSQDQLSALLKTAETLKVKGLAEVTGSSPPGSGGDITRSALGVGPPNQGGPPPSSTEGRLSPPPKRKRGRPTKRPSTDGEQLEVVESLVDVVPDGPDSVPPAQERSTEQSSVQGMELLTDAPTTISDHAHNTSDLAYDGPTQEQNSRDSSMILADQTQSSSSSLGHLPATASTSGMSPGQGSPAMWARVPYRTGPCKTWHEETMCQAIRAIFTQGVPLIEASRSSGIPYPTLFFYTNKVKQILKPYERTVPAGVVMASHGILHLTGRRGRPTKSYCGSWPEEVLSDAIKKVVYREYVPPGSRDPAPIGLSGMSPLLSQSNPIISYLAASRREMEPSCSSSNPVTSAELTLSSQDTTPTLALPKSEEMPNPDSVPVTVHSEDASIACSITGVSSITSQSNSDTFVQSCTSESKLVGQKSNSNLAISTADSNCDPNSFPQESASESASAETA